MCGCQKHHDDTQPCTCICPEHGNFEAARDLAMRRYETIRTQANRAEKAERTLAEVTAERDEAQRHIAYHLHDFRPAADMVATGDLAVDMAAYAGRLKDRAEKAEAEKTRLRDTLAVVRAEHEKVRRVAVAVERVCVAAERNGLWAGIDSRDLRAALAGGDS